MIGGWVCVIKLIVCLFYNNALSQLIDTPATEGEYTLYIENISDCTVKGNTT